MKIVDERRKSFTSIIVFSAYLSERGKFDNNERANIVWTGGTATSGETPVIATGTGTMPMLLGTRGQKFFELSNHLGNVLVSITDQKTWTIDAANGNYYAATVASATDYYAFGEAIQGRKLQPQGYRYGFNGKENDADWGTALVQDYGFRIYMQSGGRFLSVDPLTKQYPHYTPYQFAGNMPIKFIDLDGAEPATPGTKNNEYQIAKKQGTEESYGYTWSMIDVARKTLGWVQGDRTDFSRGEVEGYKRDKNHPNSDEDLVSGDNPPYPSVSAHLKDERLTDLALEENFKNAFWAGTVLTDSKEGAAFVNNFFAGGGKELSFGTNSTISKEIFNDKRFQGFATQFEDATVKYFKSFGSLNGFNGEKNLPQLFDLSGIRNNLFLAATIGGVQNVVATVTAIRVENDGHIIASFYYTLHDAFGAGTTDGTRTEFPGLVDMYVLQHYRNLNNNKYKPFILDVSMNRVRGYAPSVPFKN